MVIVSEGNTTVIHDYHVKTPSFFFALLCLFCLCYASWSSSVIMFYSVQSTEKDRLDYVDDYQDLYTTSETLDIELFQIPSVGLFAAMAHRANKPGSAIYRWVHGHFQLYQNISTFKAQAWKQFTIGRKVRKDNGCCWGAFNALQYCVTL